MNKKTATAYVQRLEAVLDAAAVAYRPLAEAEWSLVHSQWTAAFRAPKRTADNHPVTDDYLWHRFSFGVHPSLEFDPAQHEYERQAVKGRWFLLSAWKAASFGYECTGPLPNLRPLRADLLVFPRDPAWTMAFTHEDGHCGPYFAVRKK